MIQSTVEYPLKVALLIGGQQVGGTERQVAYLAEGLESAGHAVTVFFMSARPSNGSATVRFRIRQQVFLGYEAGHRVRPLVKFWRELRQRRPDVLHMFNLDAMRIGTVVAGCTGGVVQVGSIRGLRFVHDRECARRTGAVVPRMARVTVNSEAIAQELTRQGLAKAEGVVCIHNGISAEPVIRTATNRVPQILFAGSLKPVKNPECFIEACLRVLASGISCRVLVAGDGPLLDTLRALAARGGYADRFEFLGGVSPHDVPFADADVVVSTSLREGTSNTLLEAMAHGVAIVGTDAGGTATLMQKGQFGIMVPPDDIDATANAIWRLVQDPVLRQHLGACGARFVRDNFRISTMVDRHVQLYRSLRGTTH